MLRDLAWQAADELTRAQLTVFQACCDQAGLRQADRRLALGLDEAGWAAWQEFLEDGSVPAVPPIPEMLQRIGVGSFRISVAAEQLSTGKGADA